MFQHDFRRLALARDLLPDALRRSQPPARGAESDPPEAARRRDMPDRTDPNED